MDSKPGKHSIPVDVLNDLCSRFIINVPSEERQDFVRILFQVELAYWFYLDFYCTDEYPTKLKQCSMKEFTTHVFQHIEALQPYVGFIDGIISTWRGYKQVVPTYGAILLNQDLTQVLLVKSFWSRPSWGFPKGKVNKDEEPHCCAVREVLEETGFDISNLIDPNEYIESTIHDQVIRLYVIGGIQQNIKFEPKTRNEIKAVEWFPISDLPSSKKDTTSKVKIGMGANSFFLVLPFIRRIKKWIENKQQSGVYIRSRQRHKSTGDLEDYKHKDTELFGTTNSGCTTAKKSGFPTAPPVPIDEVKQFQSLDKSLIFTSRNTRKERKVNSKSRKVINKSVPVLEKESIVKKENMSSDPYNDSPPPILSVPSWVNFKFDIQAVMEILNKLL